MKLDRVNQKILFELSQNSRSQYSKLAKALRISKEASYARIKKLEETGVIQDYFINIDLEKLGYKTFKLYIRIKNQEPEIVLEIMSYLKKSKEVIVLTECEEHYNIEVVVKVKTNKELGEFIKKFKMKYERVSSIVKRTIPLFEKTFPRRYLCDVNLEETNLEHEERIKVDPTDTTILKFISNNPKFSLVSVAEELGISSTAAKARIKKLEEKKVISKYGVIIDFSKIGIEVFKVEIKLTEIRFLEKLREFLTECRNVEYYLESIDESDIEIKIECEGQTELKKIISEIKKSVNYKIKHIRYYNENKIWKINPLSN